MLTVISAGLMALVLILQLYRRRGSGYWLNSAAAFLAFCQTYINAALIAQVYQNISDGFIVESEYIIARYIVFSAVTAISIISGIREKSFHTGILPVCSFLTLPIMEFWAGRVFPAAFSAALAILLIGSVWIIVKIRKELKTSISGLSIKQVMDSLDTAILFCGQDGHILMQNHKMQEIMTKTAGRVFYDGKAYLETNVIPNSENTGIDSYLYRLPDSVWLFTVRDIQADRKIVTRITATDVTEQNKAAMILKDRNDELESRRQRLKVFVENIEQICRSEELLRIKTEIHDVQNQKLILLLQYLRYGELPDSTSFDALKTGIMHRTSENISMAADPQALLDIIVSRHESIGVNIHVDGKLPPERVIAIALTQILQEAAANSVKHGYANEIYVGILDNNVKYTMCVTDNGTRFAENIKEGSGVAGMRRRAETCGGKLEITTSPRFTLTVAIPYAKEVV